MKKKKNIVYSMTFLRTFKIFLFVKRQYFFFFLNEKFKNSIQVIFFENDLSVKRIFLLFKFSIDGSIMSLLNCRIVIT